MDTHHASRSSRYFEHCSVNTRLFALRSFAGVGLPVVTEIQDAAMDKLRRLATLGSASDARIADLALQCVADIEVIDCTAA